MKGRFLKIMVLCFAALQFHCGSSTNNGGGGGGGGGDGGGGGGGGGGGVPSGNDLPEVVFTPVGDNLAFDLIDLEFLPGQGGDSIAVTQGGDVYYLDQNFNQVGPTFNIDVQTADNHEQGLQNIVADPKFNDGGNHFVYIYYTVPEAAPEPDTNRVARFTVNVDKGANTFSLSDEKTVIEFHKSEVGAGHMAGNHNGGSMVFMNEDELAIGVGDGAGNGDIAQDETLNLGKIHRLIPDRTSVGGIDPTFPGNDVPNAPDTVYSLGVRNPFTLVVDDTGDLFMGDVGQSTAEEINCVYEANENYGWPNCEGLCECISQGNCTPPFTTYVRPIHFYLHSDSTFEDEDPAPNSGGGHSIMVSSFYKGTNYGKVFTGKILYNEFYRGWVRAATLNLLDQVTKTEHIGHQEGITGLHENPVDGLLYGPSLGGSDRILRMDLAP